MLLVRLILVRTREFAKNLLTLKATPASVPLAGKGRDVQWILMNVFPSPAKIMLYAIIFRAVTCVNVGQASLGETVTVTLMTAFQIPAKMELHVWMG